MGGWYAIGETAILHILGNYCTEPEPTPTVSLMLCRIAMAGLHTTRRLRLFRGLQYWPARAVPRHVILLLQARCLQRGPRTAVAGTLQGPRRACWTGPRLRCSVSPWRGCSYCVPGREYTVDRVERDFFQRSHPKSLGRPCGRPPQVLRYIQSCNSISSIHPFCPSPTFLGVQ